MKPIKTVRKQVVAMLAIVLLSAGAQASNGCPLSVPTSSIDTVLVTKQVTSKKQRIKLYQDADQNALFFSVKGSDEKAYQLFIFDVAGKLVQQANIKGRQTTVIDNIEKGNYLFEVFSDDERIENGQVIIK